MKSVLDQHMCTYANCHLHIGASRVKGEVVRNTPQAHLPLGCLLDLELYSHHILHSKSARWSIFCPCALPVFIGAPSTLGGLLDPGAFNEVASGEQAANL